MATQIHDFVTSEEKNAKFEFIGIDTKNDDLKEYTNNDMNRIALDTPSSIWGAQKEEYSYLHSDYELEPTGGAKRQRPVSRYYIDNIQNFENVYSRLSTIISEFVDERGNDFDEEEMDGANVWLVNALGGGTGSGTFPLLSFMLRNILDEIDEAFFVGGVGSLPSLGDEDLTLGTEGNANYYANAYAALRDLMYIVDYDDAGNYPISIPIEADVGPSEFTVEESPFDFYSLLAFREGEMSQDYREQMNNTVATLICLFSEMGGIENFQNDPNIPDSILHSIDGGILEVPVRDLDKLLDIKDRQDALEVELDSVADELEAYREDRDYLQDVVDLHTGEIPEESSPVEEKIVRTARSRAQSLDLEYFDEETLIEERNRCREQIPDLNRNFEMDSVGDYLFYNELAEIIRTKIREHSFEEEIENEWSQYRGKISDADRLDEMDARAKWEDGLQRFYANWEDTLREKYENLGGHRLFKKREISETLDQVESRNTQLGGLYNTYRQLDDAKEVVEARRKECRETLLETTSEYTDHLESLEQEQLELETEQAQYENQRTSIENRLSDFSKSQHTTLPFTNFETFNRRMIEEADSIQYFIDRGVVTESQVAHALNYLIDSLEEPVQDLETYNKTVNVFDYLGVIATRENQSLMDLDAENRQKLSGQVDSFNWVRYENLRNQFVIRLVSMYGRIALENTSEYQTLHEHYMAESESVKDLLNIDEDEDYMPKKFAYPEFHEEDTRVQTYFGLADNIATLNEDSE